MAWPSTDQDLLTLTPRHFPNASSVVALLLLLSLPRHGPGFKNGPPLTLASACATDFYNVALRYCAQAIKWLWLLCPGARKWLQWT
jgi:hypothetical protein